MGRLFGCCRGVLADCHGISAMEYAIMGGVIAVAVAYGMSLESDAIAQTWQVVMNAFPSNSP